MKHSSFARHAWLVSLPLIAVSMLILFRNMTNSLSTLGPFKDKNANCNADNISTGICAADCFWCFDHLCHNPYWRLSPGMFCKILQLLLVLGFRIWICKYDTHVSFIRLFFCGSLFAHTMQEDNISEFRGWDILFIIYFIF